jgi:hypothetical protein
MRPIPRASRAHGESTVRTEVFDGFLFAGFLFADAFLAGRFRDPPVPDLREGEVFVGMVR